jgi:hypothetical protein
VNNIVSYRNAGKRRYGENHWFWAVWIGVKVVDRWDESEPTESGFCSSKRLARRAAWDAIRRNGQQRAYDRGICWAWDYLAHQDEQDDRPDFSRCKISANKWFWVVCSDAVAAACDDEPPLAQGFANSSGLAQAAAEQAVGPVCQTGNWVADHFRRKGAALKRQQRTTTNQDAGRVEFVYDCHSYYSDYTHEEDDVITKHRIVKKTRRRIYVERESVRKNLNLFDDWRDYVQDTFILDREEFERTGVAWSRSCRKSFYSDPEVYRLERAEQARNNRPACFVGLGVMGDAGEKEIKAAYRRLAKKTHPDCGGDAEDFKRVRLWYEQAMVMAQ